MNVPEAVRQAATEFWRATLQNVNEERARYEQRVAVARSFVAHLEGGAAETFERSLTELAGRHPGVESVSVLDALGTQVTETVWSPGSSEAPKVLIYRPPRRGSSHALKEYYYLLTEAGFDPFETRPYVPLPTGSLCVTLTTRFGGAAREPCILCLHLNVDELRHSNVFQAGTPSHAVCCCFGKF